MDLQNIRDNNCKFAEDGVIHRNRYKDNFIFDPIILEDSEKEPFEETFDKDLKFLEGRKEVLTNSAKSTKPNYIICICIK